MYRCEDVRLHNIVKVRVIDREESGKITIIDDNTFCVKMNDGKSITFVKSTGKQNSAFPWAYIISIETPKIPPRMTAEQYDEKAKQLFEQDNIPKEFHGYFSHLAYEQSHSYGYEECLSTLIDMTDGFADCLKNYFRRMREIV